MHILCHSLADKTCLYTALLLSTSISESSTLVSPGPLILFMLYEVTLCNTRKTDADDMSDEPTLQQNMHIE